MQKPRKCKPIIIIIILAVLMSMSTYVTAGDANLPYSAYTYTRSGDYSDSPPAYVVSKLVDIRDEENIALSHPTDFAIDSEGNIIIVDRGNNRILCVDSGFEPVWEIRSISGLQGEYVLNRPYGVAICPHGNIYLTDEGAQPGEGRIFKLSKDRDLLQVYHRPQISLLGEDYLYQPMRLAVDKTRRMYVIARHINQGFIQLDTEGNFQGFFGSPRVRPNPWELLLRYISTDEHIARTRQFVPTEYIGVDIDDDGFIYAITSAFSTSDIYAMIYSQRNVGGQVSTGQTEMFRRLNPAGADITRRMGGFSPIGDLRLPNLAIPGAPVIPSEVLRGDEAVVGPSRFGDIKAIYGGIYIMLDQLRNRIFAYDYDGNLLFVFGGSGSRQESFLSPVAVEYHEGNIYVLNSGNSTISVFKPTVYGGQVLEATVSQHRGDYQKAEAIWNNILVQNANYEFAYDALGKLYMNNNDFAAAMTYFRLADNRTNYSRALKNRRGELVDEYFLLIVLMLVVVLVSIKLASKVVVYIERKNLKAKHILSKIRYIFYVAKHPFDGFWDLKHEQRGSFRIAFAMYIIMGVVSVMRRNASAYVFNMTDPRYTNIITEFIIVVMPFLLFVIANWCLTTLMDGKGTLPDVFRYVGYSLLPVIISNILVLCLSYALSQDEAMILSVISGIGLIWTLGLIFAGTVATHDYSAGKTVLTLGLSVGGMVFIVFVSVIFINIIEQMVDFGVMIYDDLSIRQ